VTTAQVAGSLPAAIFKEAMARLVSGVAVITARRADGMPCGLLVTSICSYSVRPPSVLVSVAQETRTYRALADCAEFGTHLLGTDHADLAGVFAGRGDDKFTHVPWSWDDDVPRLHDVPVYLHCTARRLFHHGDHAIVIGEVSDGQLRPTEPLIYYRRRLNWRIDVLS
jgi:flavin reductase ActVB